MPRLLALLLVLVALAACGRPSAGQFPDISLPTLSGKQSSSLASCATSKCLTVVVAPWCGYCRQGTPMMLRLRDWLSERGVSMRVIVGLAGLAEVRDYAAEFGGDAMLDPDGRFKVSGGVPHFYVSDPSGAIVKDVAGMPMTEDPARFAGFFGLP